VREEDIPADDLVWLFAENLELPAGFGARLLLDHGKQDWRTFCPASTSRPSCLHAR
jgi:hypothetical protein